jgi:eukaryotic-like serine/threonine-protein kinase
MPAPDPARWQRLKELFEAADKLRGADRDEFLDSACADDLALREELQGLLAAHRDDRFLEPQLPTELQQIGPFTLRRVIGAGGMGTVYEASQNHPHRTVALKVLRPFGALPGAARRFAQEAEILARLQHPGIAQVHAAGTTDWQGVTVPWFAMEFIAGARPLVAFANATHQDRRQRLMLFLEVCAAVQHGHHKGVVHRDLKPGNVLVDQTGAVKVIDFGVARAASLDAEQTSLHTSAGELLGTLAYMSPEQCLGDPDAVDTRSDVHALGVMLYELLTGRLPFRVQGMDLLAAVNVVATAAPAPCPELPIDVQAILGKALEKVPDERYPSVDALAHDVRCVLEDRPPTARPAGPVRQFQLYARRHRARVIAGATVAVVLVAASVVSTVFAIEAQNRAAETLRALTVAAGERDSAQQNLDLLLRSLRAANPMREAKDVSVSELLDRTAEELAKSTTTDRYSSARLHQTLAAAYRGIGRSVEAVQQGEAALADLDSMPSTHVDDRIEGLLVLGAVHGDAGDPEAACRRLQQVLQLLPDDTSAPDARRVQALQGIGAARLAARDLRGAAEWLEQAVACPRGPGDEQFRGEALANLGTLSWQRGDNERAASLWQEALDLFANSLWPEHPTVAQVRSNYGLCLQNQGRHREAAAMFTAARDLFTRLRGATSPDVANAELKIGFLCIDMGDAAGAQQAFDRCLEIRRARFGNDAQQVPAVLQAIGYLRLQQEQWPQALTVLDEAVALRTAKLPANHRDVQDGQLLRARALLGLQRPAEAEPLLRSVVAQRTKDFGPENARTAMAQSALGECLLQRGAMDDARPLLEGSMGRIEKAFGKRHPECRAARRRLADLEERSGQPQAAQRLRQDG